MKTDHWWFVQLGWWLLEAKYIYYCQDGRGGPADALYDETEREYTALAHKLGRTPTVSNMVGFDRDKPSSAMVETQVGMRGMGEHPKEKLLTLTKGV